MAIAPTQPGHPRQAYRDLFVLSLFMLYLELLLIRWIGTEIRVFAYVSNLALIACFLGMGVGCLLSRKPRPSFVVTYPLLALFLAVVLLPKSLGTDIYRVVTTYMGDFNEMPLWNWGATEGKPILPRLAALGLLVAMFAFIGLLFVPAGRLMGRLFAQCPGRIAAYSTNLAGSLAGIWLFSGLSFLALPPSVWFVVAAVAGACLLRNRRDLILAAASGLVGVGAVALRPTGGDTVLWSPYQKLAFRPATVSAPSGESILTGYHLDVNETFYQRIVNLDRSFLERHVDLWPGVKEADYVGYNLIYRIQTGAEDVLVVGAGTGNDVAAALRNGAQHVDAVEIDPVIVRLGHQYHPEQPYADPRVTVHVDDARSFFKKTRRRYDLIVFGALDSHTLSSSLSNLRIDNYVYTVESFREARDLLKPGGVLSLVFAIERPFIGIRLHGMLQEAFGRAPLAFHAPELQPFWGTGGGPTFVADLEGQIEEKLRRDPKVEALVNERRMTFSGEVPLGRDDWPYLYLADKLIPRLYTIVLGALLVMALLTARPFLGEFRRIDPTFFLLGAGFLLIEVQSISKMALLFGSTWIVNSVVISAILCAILATNLIAARVRIRSLVPLYVGIFASLLLNLLFPFHALLALPPLWKGVAAGLTMSLPVLFSGLVFIVVFARAQAPDAALGSNILGAIAGGASECLSFLVGINALGLVAMGFYALSLVCLVRRKQLRC